jgi:SAM-dependent methyltransferase
MQCRVCGSEQDHPVHDAREMMYGLREVHRYFQCASCGCLQIAAIPASMAPYYGKDYYSFHAPSRTGLKARLIDARNRHAALQQGLLGAMLSRLQPTRQFDFLQPIRTSIGATSRVLDVGCGAGNLLRNLRSAGMTEVMGVDPFIEQDIAVDGRCLVRKSHLEDVAGTFDLVMFNHSFEHMPDQAATLKCAHRLIAPGGHCLVRIPLVSSHAWQKYGVDWVQLDAPRHFYLHSADSLKLMAGRIGFDCVAVVYDSTAFQFWGSEQYVKDIPLKDPRSFSVDPDNSLFSAADIARFAEQSVQLNATRQGDQAAFYLRKAAT